MLIELAGIALRELLHMRCQLWLEHVAAQAVYQNDLKVQWLLRSGSALQRSQWVIQLPYPGLVRAGCQPGGHMSLSTVTNVYQTILDQQLLGSKATFHRQLLSHASHRHIVGGVSPGKNAHR